jgi:hypothetical protein
MNHELRNSKPVRLQSPTKLKACFYKNSLFLINFDENNFVLKQLCNEQNFCLSTSKKYYVFDDNPACKYPDFPLLISRHVS